MDKRLQKLTGQREENYMLKESTVLKFFKLQRLVVLLKPKKRWHTWDTKSLPLLPRISGITNQLPDVPEAGGPYAQRLQNAYI